MVVLEKVLHTTGLEPFKIQTTQAEFGRMTLFQAEFSSARYNAEEYIPSTYLKAL